MTSSACYESPVLRATNNRFPSCPPMMSDSRNFTDHRPKGVQALQDIVPLNKGSYDFRQQLEAHGSSMIQDLRRSTYAHNVCGPCKQPYEKGTLMPELATESCGHNACAFVQASENGVGLGRDFGESADAANAYAAFLEEKRREQATLARLPCNLAYDPFKDFPLRYDGPSAGRLESPLGGGGGAMSPF